MSGAQCCDNPPTLSSSSGGGSVDKIGGLKAYFTGSSDSKLAILLISDVYGYEAPNLRKLADKVAANGYYVVVPDFFYGDPYAPENAERPLPVWVMSHGTDKGFEDAKPVVAALRSKGITAIGAAGFCWGAKVVVELSKSDYIQAAVLLHPTFVTIDDIKEIKAPIAILGAERDKISPPELLKQFEEVLTTRPEIKGYVKIFAGTAHGWTVRYKTEDEKAVKDAEEAHQNMLDWFVEQHQMMRRKNPDIMCTSVEKITAMMDFLVNKMDWDSSAVAAAPKLFSLSLRKNIMPKCVVIRVLQLKELIREEIALSNLTFSKKLFSDRYLFRHLEQVSQLFDIFEGKVDPLELGYRFEEKLDTKLM